MSSSPSPTYRTLSGFFLPLAIQAASQALSYPLVAMVASRGPGGPVNLAGLAQSNTVMFFLGMFAISSVTTGMVYAKTREGYQKFRLMIRATGLVIIGIQAVLCIPAVSHLLFGRIIGLPPSIEQPAQITLISCLPLQFLFFFRIPYFVVMYVGRATAKASMATIARIILTAMLSPLFCIVGLVGPIWAVVCLTIPVALEALVSGIFAVPFIRSLEPCREKPPGVKEIFIFNIPLSVGGYFLVASAIILAAFIARAPDPDRILPIYYLALGLVNPMSFAATRIQAVVIAFPPQSLQERRTLRFSLAAGALLGMLPLIFTLPGLAELYYVKLQKLDLADLGLVRMTAVSLIFFPLSVAIRAQSEGLAAWLKKPTTVLTGHGMFLITIVVAGFTLLMLGTPGQVIGAVGLTLGSLASSATMRLLLMRAKERAFPVGQTTTSLGQIR
ncbi:hypothetical protein D1BOALGB6SA_3308 [Olavius sp. associated proteobacterium Delta 1]|nr:hypothetical protein D1BOALGB6SA_3308 [Olavius sp. associated proteobacterium Delta 1]